MDGSGLKKEPKSLLVLSLLENFTPSTKLEYIINNIKIIIIYNVAIETIKNEIKAKANIHLEQLELNPIL